MALCLILCLLIFPNFLKAHSQGQLTQCKTNLKNLATALEFYASDNDGRYPTRLDKLARGKAYLLELPTCPADTGAAYAYRVSSRPDCFSLRCEGIHHFQAPRYSSEIQCHDHP